VLNYPPRQALVLSTHRLHIDGDASNRQHKLDTDALL